MPQPVSGGTEPGRRVESHAAAWIPSVKGLKPFSEGSEPAPALEFHKVGAQARPKRSSQLLLYLTHAYDTGTNQVEASLASHRCIGEEEI